ncbi:MAG: hypothetical protein MUC87_07955 [Bacteroidia bacterium]|jgi:hypothetical protein|nr:hypothetical protein [Bacteroidia bacterium]
MKRFYTVAVAFIVAAAFTGCKPKAAVTTAPPLPATPVATNTPAPLPPDTDTIDMENDSFFVHGPARKGTGGTTTTPDTTKTTTGSTTQTTPAVQNYRLVVLFISRGSGINEKARVDFESWLKNQSKPVKWENTRWGREGEQSYCLKLDEFSTSREQDKFVQDARIALAGKDLVIIEENVPCKGKR